MVSADGATGFSVKLMDETFDQPHTANVIISVAFVRPVMSLAYILHDTSVPGATVLFCH